MKKRRELNHFAVNTHYETLVKLHGLSKCGVPEIVKFAESLAKQIALKGKSPTSGQMMTWLAHLMTLEKMKVQNER